MTGAAVTAGLLAGSISRKGRPGTKAESMEDQSEPGEESDKDSGVGGVVELDENDSQNEMGNSEKLVDCRSPPNLEDECRECQNEVGSSDYFQEDVNDIIELSSRKARQAHKKAVKAERRALREGTSEAVATKKKPCEVCERHVDLLVRCTHDSSQKWCMLCGGCWKKASGGVPDGDADHPYYRYGGLWKNRSADLSSMPGFSCRS